MAEKRVAFNEITDKTVYSVIDDESGRTLAEITGYNVEVKFNMEEINSSDDIDAISQGIGNIFKRLLLDNILKQNK